MFPLKWFLAQLVTGLCGLSEELSTRFGFDRCTHIVPTEVGGSLHLLPRNKLCSLGLQSIAVTSALVTLLSHCSGERSLLWSFPFASTPGSSTALLGFTASEPLLPLLLPLRLSLVGAIGGTITISPLVVEAIVLLVVVLSTVLLARRT